MADVLKQFKRARTFEEIKPIKMAVSRAVERKELKQLKYNYYYKKGWFENLGASYTMKDAVLFFMLALGNFLANPLVKQNNDPDALRSLSRALNNLTFQMRRVSDELIERAELLEGPQEEAD